MNFDERLNRFRIASRELSNLAVALRSPTPVAARDEQDRFSAIEDLLFESLVTAPAGLARVPYGTRHPGIRVAVRGECAEAHVNREIASGYWDHPLDVVTRDAEMAFVEFFDWDPFSWRDNRWVHVTIDAWPAHPEAVGKHALVDALAVSYAAASAAPGDDESAIRQVIATWIAASKAGDMPTVLSLMTDDVVFLRPGQPPLRGKAEFEAASRGGPPPDLEAHSEVREIRVCGDVAHVWTRLEIRATPEPGAPAVTRAGDTLSVLRREGRRWLFARDANLLVLVR